MFLFFRSISQELILRGKIRVLLGWQRRFMVNMENVTYIDESVVQMFLQILNSVKAKGGELGLIFKNETLTRAFAPFFNLIPVYPDDSTAAPTGLLATLRRRGVLLSRKTGVRISRPVAIFVLIVLCGWFATLLFIIRLQNSHLKEQQQELYELTTTNNMRSSKLTECRKDCVPWSSWESLKIPLRKSHDQTNNPSD